MTGRINFCYNPNVGYEKAFESVMKFCSIEGQFDYHELVDFLTDKFHNMDEVQMEKNKQVKEKLR